MLPVALDDVNVTEPPEQNEVAPFAEMVGVAGAAITLTATLADVDEHEPFETVTL